VSKPKKTVQVPKIAIIGAGKMGEGIIIGLLKSGVYSPQDIRAYDILENRCKYITQTYKVECPSDVKKAVAFGDICLIAVKPGEGEGSGTDWTSHEAWQIADFNCSRRPIRLLSQASA